MSLFLYIIQILLCIALVVVVLMQSGRGSGLAGFVSDSMGQSMFGGSGGRPFFIKLTTGIAIAFMLVCFLQAWMTAHQGNQYHGVFSGYQGGQAQQSAPANPPVQPAAPQPQGAAPSLPAPAK